MKSFLTIALFLSASVFTVSCGTSPSQSGFSEEQKQPAPTYKLTESDVNQIPNSLLDLSVTPRADNGTRINGFTVRKVEKGSMFDAKMGLLAGDILRGYKCDHDAATTKFSHISSFSLFLHNALSLSYDRNDVTDTGAVVVVRENVPSKEVEVFIERDGKPMTLKWVITKDK